MNNLFEEQLKKFDDSFMPKFPHSGFEPITGLTANVHTIKSFLQDCQSQWSTHMREVLEGCIKEIDERKWLKSNEIPQSAIGQIAGTPFDSSKYDDKVRIHNGSKDQDIEIIKLTMEKI